MEARRAHNPEVVGSSPTSATTKADTKRCLFFIIYLDSNLRHVAPNAQAFGRNSPGDCFVASAQSRSYLRNHQGRHQIGVCFFILLLGSNLRHVAPNAQAFGRNSPGDCFVASAQSRSYLRNHQDGVCLRRLFSFTGLKTTFVLHINRHRKFRCLFSVCQREKRIDLTIENMV